MSRERPMQTIMDPFIQAREWLTEVQNIYFLWRIQPRISCAKGWWFKINSQAFGSLNLNVLTVAQHPTSTYLSNTPLTLFSLPVGNSIYTNPRLGYSGLQRHDLLDKRLKPLPYFCFPLHKFTVLFSLRAGPRGGETGEIIWASLATILKLQ